MSALEHWNPLTPLAAATFLVVAAYAAPQPAGAIASFAVALGGAWVLGVGRRVSALALAVALPTSALLLTMDALVPGAPGIATHILALGPVRLDVTAVRVAMLIAAQLGAAIAAMGWVVVGVAPRRLTRALAARGLPAWAAYVLVASLEAVPEARRHAVEVMDAQRCRGLNTGGGIVGRVRALLPLAGPLSVSLVSESEERALALDARGFRPRSRRGTLTPIADPRAERVTRALLWWSSAAVLAWRIAVAWRGSAS
ncbi:MAG TPA: energy-coupling factor transporter transmembrane component T [Gemmatimonadaceae bacterium]